MSPAEAKRHLFNGAYARYHAIIEGYLKAKLRNTHDSEDLAQEIFARLFAHAETVDNVRAWLMGTAVNLLRRHYRDSLRETEELPLFDDELDLKCVAAPEITEARIILNESLETLEEDEERALIDLIAVGNRTYQEAAQHLRISETRARYRYSKAVCRVKRHLALKGIRRVADLE